MSKHKQISVWRTKNEIKNRRRRKSQKSPEEKEEEDSRMRKGLWLAAASWKWPPDLASAIAYLLHEFLFRRWYDREISFYRRRLVLQGPPKVFLLFFFFFAWTLFHKLIYKLCKYLQIFVPNVFKSIDILLLFCLLASEAMRFKSIPKMVFFFWSILKWF